MIYTLKNSLLIFSLLAILVCFQSCESEGCTDPNGENYDPEAEVDDGTCTFARTKFIGTYGAGESCGGGDAVSFVVVIEASPTATNEIEITDQRANITVIGIVSGNSFTIDDTFLDDGVTVNMKGDGTYSVSGDDEEINVDYTFTATQNGQPASQSCTGFWSKN